MRLPGGADVQQRGLSVDDLHVRRAVLRPEQLRNGVLRVVWHQSDVYGRVVCFRVQLLRKGLRTQ